MGSNVAWRNFLELESNHTDQPRFTGMVPDGKLLKQIFSSKTKTVMPNAEDINVSIGNPSPRMVE